MVDGGFNVGPTNTALKDIADELHITGRPEGTSRTAGRPATMMSPVPPFLTRQHRP
jgi:hypothetical protein